MNSKSAFSKRSSVAATAQPTQGWPFKYSKNNYLQPELIRAVDAGSTSSVLTILC